MYFKNPPDSELIKYAVNAVNHMELSKYVGQGVDILYKSITNVGKFGLQVLLSLILSLFFLLKRLVSLLLLQNLKKADLQFSILKLNTSVRNLHVHSER